jgi:hypothetical protein
MKKVVFIIIGLVFALTLNISAWVSINPATSITPSQTVEGNLFGGSSNFALALISPRNNTYLNNHSILLNYSVRGQQAVKYKLDSGANTTINSTIFFNTSEGSHILYVYANNSAGEEITKNVTFFVNSTKFSVIYTEYAGSKKGDSTNFSIYSYEELQNLSNIILENDYDGKIKFNENINLTADFNFSDNKVDLDAYTNISLNRIEMNSTALPNFNKRATLYLYSLSFTNPQILKDGVICPDSICTKESYIAGTLTFNVTEFSSTYSAQESQNGTTTVIVINNGGSSSGGGGGGMVNILTPKVTSFAINPNEIKISSTAGKIVTEEIVLTNKLNRSITLNLEQKNLDAFLVSKDNNITLRPGESKSISLDFGIRKGTIPDMYLGKISFVDKADNAQLDILTVIEVVSEGALLDVSTQIQPEYLKVFPGQDILAKITLFNVGTSTAKRDIFIEYVLKNGDGKLIGDYKETVSIETQTMWIKRFTVPQNTEYGKYALYVKATTIDGKIASATDTFDVIAPQTGRIYILIISLIIIVGLIVLYFTKKKERKTIKKIGLKDIIKEE